MQISLDEAQQLILKSQLLNSSSKSASGKEGVAQVIGQLGYVQIDTINVIERAHHHTMFARVDDYNQNMLSELLAKDRAIFEYWGHAMSYLPMSDYRFYLPRMKNFYHPQGKWMRLQLEHAGHLLDVVRERITAEGSLSAKDFSSDKQKGGTWWDWKPAKVALEILFWRGELMITKRHKFQKVYDLTERVLPTTIDTTVPDNNEIANFLVRRALKAMGIANEKEIQKFLQPEAGRDSDLRAVDKKEISRVIQQLLESGEIVNIKLENLSDTTFYAFSQLIEDATYDDETVKEIHILSPFDNLIIQRDRISRLFGFDYTLECYLPEPKRKYGYFVLPILYGERFVGRMDAKADRKSKTLVIKSMTFENDFVPDEQFLFDLSRVLLKFTQFNECNRTKLPKDLPEKVD